MTLTLGDFNQDGRQDLYHTNTWFGGDGLGSKLLVQQENGHFTEESAEHNLALDQFCWGAVWMDVDNDTDLDLFVTEHNGLEPYGQNFLWENQVEMNMNTGETSHVFEAFGEDVLGLTTSTRTWWPRATWTETAGWILWCTTWATTRHASG